jgi:histidinol-phosphate aminotransferase
MHPRDLSSHTEYVPGRGSEEVARELGMDPEELVELSSNENPHGPAPSAVDAIREAAPTVNGYPKSAHTDLTERLAERWDVTPEQVWLSPGADGAIDNLSRAVLDPDDEILVPEPGFAYYAMSARYHHGDANEYAIEKAEDFAQTPASVLDAYDGERMVYLTTPHNPTGTAFEPAELVEIAESVDSETLVVVDEAYGEFADLPSAVDLLDEHDNVAVLRTFSKAYGLAGLRVGYAVVPESWADAYARVNTPFATGEVSCRAALAALDDGAFVESTVENARWAREYIREYLNAPTWASEGNFVLAEVGDASAVTEAAQRRGLIIRDCSSFGLPECIRVSCGTEEGTKAAVDVLNDVLAAVDTASAGD